jgi:serine/threonine-protein kinase
LGSLDEGRFLPGTLLAGRYRVVALLGRGGMGEVYRANDLKLGQPVALKFLPEETAADETTRARFYNEIRTAGRFLIPTCAVFTIWATSKASRTCRWNTWMARISDRCCAASAACPK